MNVSWVEAQRHDEVLVKKIVVNKRVINNLNNYSIYPLASQLITHRLYCYNHLGFHPPNRHKGKYVLNVPHGRNISLRFTLFTVAVSYFFEKRERRIVIDKNVTKSSVEIPINLASCSIEVWFMIRQFLINITLQSHRDGLIISCGLCLADKQKFSIKLRENIINFFFFFCFKLRAKVLLLFLLSSRTNL